MGSPHPITRKASWATAALLLLILQSLAVGKNLPWGLLPGSSGEVFWIGITSLFCAWFLFGTESLDSKIVTLFRSRAALVAWTAGNIGYLLLSYFRFSGMGYTFPWIPLIATAAVLPFVKSDRLLPAFAMNLVVLVGSILHFPINPLRSDMIPVIQHALDELASNRSPYGLFELEGRVNRMGYLPGTLLLNLPAWALGLDLRWNTLLYRGLWMTLAWSKVRTLPQKSAATTALIYFALSPYLNFRHDLYFEGFCLGIVAFLLLPSLRMFLIPVLAGVRQWAWVVLPFWLVAELGSNACSPLRSLSKMSVGVAAVVVVWFTVFGGTTTISDFRHAIFWFQSALHAPEFPGDYGISLAPALFTAGLAGALQKIQIVICAGLLLAAIRVRRRTLVVFGLGFTAWIAFVLLSPHYWLYFWNSPILALITFQLALEIRHELKVQPGRSFTELL